MDFSLNRSFVLIHYRVSKVIRKHTKLSHNHPNCFTNETYLRPSFFASP